MPIVPALRLRRDDAWVVTWRNCMLFLWQRVSVEALQAAHEVTKALQFDHPQGIVTVSCMLPGAPILPSKEARVESLRLMTELSGVVKASAAVFEGTGLVFATARVFISAIMVAATRSDQKFKVFDTVEKAAPWLAPSMQPNPTPQLIADLTEALVRGRAMHGRSTTSPSLAR
jgi:hypothetical protein